jgi:hypothetical protein
MLKTLWPDTKIATEITFGGLINYNSNAQVVNTNSDYIGVSYYPLNPDFTVKPITAIADNIEALIDLYPSKPLFFYQYGYPSSALCSSSDYLQRDFITKTFEIWDLHPIAIKGFDFTWLHDLDPVMVDYWGEYYGLTDEVFLEYLRTIGMRTFEGMGTDKPAMQELLCQAALNGFSDVDVECITTISDDNLVATLTIYPNPVKDYFSIKRLPENASTITLYNMYGEMVSIIAKPKAEIIAVTHLANGTYAVVIKDGAKTIAIDKFVVIK